MIKQLLDEVDHDIMDYECRGLSYLPKPKVEDDSIQFTISFTIGRKRTPNFHVKLASFVLVADLHIFTGLEINYQFHLLS